MQRSSGKLRRFALTIAVGLAVGAIAPQAAGARPQTAASCHRACDDVRFSILKGFDDPATPDDLDRVGVLEVGPERARNVLVLSPGTSAGAGYFKPLADDIVRRAHGRWQVWSVERRENLLEDQSVLDLAKQGKATPQQLFDYYLGWLTNPSITNHFQPVPDSMVPFARGWGMNVEIQDLHRVVQAAGEHGRRVVLGGHSLGGSITTAYATWDFHDRPGARDLSGLVFIDGGSNPVPVSPEQATQSLQNLQNGTPWLAFGGIPAPFLGLFSATGSTAAVIDPNGPSLAQTFPLLPANLKPPVPATNEAQFGFGVATETSPPSLIAAQVHAGHLAASGDPRAVADGNANPAQAILGVDAIHGDDLGMRMPIYAFGAALGGQGVLDTARVLARQSGIPETRLTLVNRQSTYAHNDPSAASPSNEFLDNLIPFLATIDHKGPSLHQAA